MKLKKGTYSHFNDIANDVEIGCNDCGTRSEFEGAPIFTKLVRDSHRCGPHQLRGFVDGEVLATELNLLHP